MLTLGGQCYELVSSYPRPSGETHRLSKGRKSDRNAASKTSSPLVAVTKQKAVPSMEFSRADRNSGEKRSGGHRVGSVQALYRIIISSGYIIDSERLE